MDDSASANRTRAVEIAVAARSRAGWPRYTRCMHRATAASRSQHVVLRRLADELLVLLDPALELDVPAVRDALQRLDDVIKLHSTMEVDGMYPQLLQHPDAEIRALAAKMLNRIKDVYDGFVTFRDAWTPERIRTNRETFVKQARFVVAALHESTTREEEGLYARVDAAFEGLPRAK